VKARTLVVLELPDALDAALHLPEEDAVGKFVNDRAQFLNISHSFRTHVSEDALPSFRRRRVLVDSGSGGSSRNKGAPASTALASTRNPVDSALEPEAQYFSKGLAHLGVMPIQVRLLRQKSMVVVLACLVVPLPGAAAETTQPIVGRPAIWARIGPNVPISFWTVAG